MLVFLVSVTAPTTELSLRCGWVRSLVSGRVSKGDRVPSSSTTLSSISVRADSRVSLSSSTPLLSWRRRPESSFTHLYAKVIFHQHVVSVNFVPWRRVNSKRGHLLHYTVMMCFNSDLWSDSGVFKNGQDWVIHAGLCVHLQAFHITSTQDQLQRHKHTNIISHPGVVTLNAHWSDLFRPHAIL